MILGSLLVLSLPGLDNVTHIVEHGFTEGMNKPLVSSNLLTDFKKITQEILTSQMYMDEISVPDKIIDSFLKEPHCGDCGDSSDIEIIRNNFSGIHINSNFQNVTSEYILAVIPSKRSDSTESIVVSISFPWKFNPKKNELGSISGLVISFSKYISTVDWLSKDVYFLFTDSNIPFSLGIYAFLKDLSSDLNLIRYNNKIRTAFCIEITSSTPTKILFDIGKFVLSSLNLLIQNF